MSTSRIYSLLDHATDLATGGPLHHAQTFELLALTDQARLFLGPDDPIEPSSTPATIHDAVSEATRLAWDLSPAPADPAWNSFLAALSALNIHLTR